MNRHHRSTFLLFFLFTVHTSISQCTSLTEMVDVLLGDALPALEGSVITDNERVELSYDKMIAALNRTQTMFGLWGLRRISMPTLNKNKIEEAQRRLILLLKDKDLFNRINFLLDEIKSGQECLSVYYGDYSPLRSDAQSLYYYYAPGSRRLNNNKLALDVSYLLSYTSLVGGKLVLFGLLDQVTKVSMTGELPFCQGYSSFVDELIRSNTPWAVQLQDDQIHQACLIDAHTRKEMYGKGSFGDKVLLIRQGASELYPNTLQQVAMSVFGVTALTIAQAGYNVGCISIAHSIYDKARALWSTMNKLKQTTLHLARIVRAVDELAFCINQYPELAEWEPLKPLVCLLFKSGYWGANVHSLFERLYDSTFDSSSNSYWYSRGQVLLAHKNMKDVRYDLRPLWAAIAFLDAQMSIAHLYKEQQEKENSFCFVELSQSKTPYFCAKNFWLPLIHDGSIVSNSLQLGRGLASKIVLTGPNGGGKSTVMKSICWAVILGQSWGIIPAESAQMGIFAKIMTAINPSEDIAKGLSTFMAEKHCMDCIEKSISQSNGNGCILVALDEPYRGTVEVEAADRVCDFCATIACRNHVALLLATHLERPAHLEKELSCFANYQMQFAQHNDGTISRSFELVPGAAYWWFNDAVMRKKIIETLKV